MKLLFDENISYRIVKRILEIYPSSEHVTNVMPALRDDSAIFDYARKKGLIIVTFDEDFREIQSLAGFPPKIVWMRMGNTSTLNILSKLVSSQREIIELHENEEIGILELY